MEKTFYQCKKCGALSEVILASGCELHCCGEQMTKLEANVTEAATEKHIPQITVNGSRVTVNVGSVEHPMLPEHFIQFVELIQSGKSQRVELDPACKPIATFILDTIEDFDVYEYCNVHGLWKNSYTFDD